MKGQMARIVYNQVDKTVYKVVPYAPKDLPKSPTWRQDGLKRAQDGSKKS